MATAERSTPHAEPSKAQGSWDDTAQETGLELAT